ncbi:MAG: GNAT family N-acetyltransferase [Chloroflexota bacterium]
MNVSQATLEHLDQVADLFDQYRQFYEQPPNYEGCRAFMKDRITNQESVIFIAKNAEGELVGFTQLYNSFCSVALKPLVYLYDLFVVPSARRTGVAQALMNQAKAYAEARQADRLTLETQTNNIPGQTLYEALGYEKDIEFFTYHLGL